MLNFNGFTSGYLQFFHPELVSSIRFGPLVILLIEVSGPLSAYLSLLTFDLDECLSRSCPILVSLPPPFKFCLANLRELLVTCSELLIFFQNPLSYVLIRCYIFVQCVVDPLYGSYVMFWFPSILGFMPPITFRKGRI